jgi:hypothetical protein
MAIKPFPALFPQVPNVLINQGVQEKAFNRFLDNGGGFPGIASREVYTNYPHITLEHTLRKDMRKAVENILGDEARVNLIAQFSNGHGHTVTLNQGSSPQTHFLLSATDKEPAKLHEGATAVSIVSHAVIHRKEGFAKPEPGKPFYEVTNYGSSHHPDAVFPEDRSGLKLPLNHLFQFLQTPFQSGASLFPYLWPGTALVWAHDKQPPLKVDLFLKSDLACLPKRMQTGLKQAADIFSAFNPELDYTKREHFKKP